MPARINAIPASSAPPPRTAAPRPAAWPPPARPGWTGPRWTRAPGAPPAATAAGRRGDEHDVDHAQRQLPAPLRGNLRHQPATGAMTSPPNSICQAVNTITSGRWRSNMRGQHRAHAPAQSTAQSQQHGLDIAQPVPGLDETDQADRRQPDAGGMPDSGALAQPPGEQHHPERHGVGHQRHLANAARDQRGLDEALESGRLRQPDQQRQPQGGMASGRRVARGRTNSTTAPVT